MNRTAAFTMLLLWGCASRPGGDLSSPLQAITEKDVHDNLFYLASDSMLGRNTPSPQLDSAGASIARYFARHGLEPLGGSYLHRIPLEIISLGEKNSLTLFEGAKESDFQIKSDFTPFEMTANRQVRAPLVFAGYGITAPEYGYDDYAGIDVRGRIVVVLRHEPREEDTGSVFRGATATPYSNVERKVEIAREHGAVGVLVMTDPLHHTSLAPRGFPWPSLTRTIPHDALPLTLGEQESEKLPVVHVGKRVIDELFGSVDSLRALQASIDSLMRPHSFVIAGVEASLQTTTEIESKSAADVLGYLPGSDPVLKNQVVIVGAHYDHVGYKKQHGEGEDSVYNGADDNASGTCALMGVAEGLGALQQRPRRSILLIAFAGEEKGLFGSEYYARHPAIPLDSTVAMLNMDMVGRNGRDSLYLIGGDSSPDLDSVARQANHEVGFILTDDVLSSGGSDHMSFQKRKVPSLFFHSGLEGEYHTVRDNPELIDIAKVTATARLVFVTAVLLANDTHRYRYISKPITLF